MIRRALGARLGKVVLAIAGAEQREGVITPAPGAMAGHSLFLGTARGRP